MGRGSEQTFSQRRQTSGQQAHTWKMLNITDHQGDAHQHHNEVPPHTCQNGHCQKDNRQHVLARTWMKENPVHCWWECKMAQSLWKAVWKFFIILQRQLPYDTTIPLMGIYPKETKTLTQKDICTPIFCSIIYSSWDENTLCTDEWTKKENVIYIHNGIFISHKKRMKSCHSQQRGRTSRPLCLVR